MAEAAVLHRLLLLCIVIGLAFSIWATLEVTFPSVQGTCSVNSVLSCKTVDSSGHNNVGPLPDWSLGVGGFLLYLALDIPLLRSYDVRLLQAILLLSVLAVAFSAYFVYLELFVIGAVCPVCTGAHAANLGVLGVSLALLRQRNRALKEEESGKKGTRARRSAGA